MKKVAHLLVAVLLWACLSAVARADSVTLNLTNPFQYYTGPVGGTALFRYYGTVTAPATNASTFYIGGIDQPGQRDQITTTPLFDSLKSGLAPGQSVTGELFDYSIFEYVTPVPVGGTVTFGSRFYLEGGSSPLYTPDLDPAYSVSVAYTIGPAVAPEPPAWVLAAIGLVLLALVRGRLWEVWRHSASAAVAS